jgi:hypothetical protein
MTVSLKKILKKNPQNPTVFKRYFTQQRDDGEVLRGRDHRGQRERRRGPERHGGERMDSGIKPE